MRILTVTTSFPGIRARYNGVFVREHCHTLTCLGHEVTVIVPRVFREDPLREVDRDIRVRRFRFWSAQKLLIEYRGIPVIRIATLLISGLANILCEKLFNRSIDIIHGHWAIPSGLMAVVAGRLLRLPVIITVHRADIVMAIGGNPFARILMNFTLHKANRVIVVGKFQVDQIQKEFSLPSGKIEVVPMGADTELFKPASRVASREWLGLPASSRIVLFVGGLTKVKGVQELILAIPGLRERHQNLLLLMAGSGPLSDELMITVKNFCLKGAVQFLGSVEHDQLPCYMNAADVIVLPSRSEGLPVCLMEAAAVGLPIVATNVGACSEIVGLNSKSRLISQGDPVLIAKALGDVLDFSSDLPDLRSSNLISNGHYTLQGAVTRIIEIYKKLISEFDCRHKGL